MEQRLIISTLRLPVQMLSILSHILWILYLLINDICHRSTIIGTAFSSIREQLTKRDVSCIYRGIPLIVMILSARSCVYESVAYSGRVLIAYAWSQCRIWQLDRYPVVLLIILFRRQLQVNTRRQFLHTLLLSVAITHTCC